MGTEVAMCNIIGSIGSTVVGSVNDSATLKKLSAEFIYGFGIPGQLPKLHVKYRFNLIDEKN